TKAGVYQVTATLENGDSMQQTVTYVPNVANAEITLAASKDPVIADNNDLTTLTATVADTEGNAIANTEVTFTLPEDVRANFTLSDGGKAITNVEGKAKVTLKGTKAGAHTVTASITGGKSEQLVVNFTADTLTAQVNLNVTEDNFIANNVGMTRLQATVTDGNGNPLANEAVTFTLPADVSASFTLGQGGSAITDINGKAEVTLSGTKSGTYPVTVSVNNYGVSDTKQVTLIADAGTAKLASLTSVYSFVVSTTEGATMTASVTDANGNPVEGIKVNFRGTSVTLSSTSVETDDRGFAEILVTSTEVGLKTVSASLADKPTEVISRLLNAKADINSATITSLEIPEGQVMVAQDVAVKAHVNDQFGNPILNESVTFSAEPPEHMTISQNIVSTDTHGIAEVTMTPERNGSYMVKASLANGSSYEKDLVVIDQKLTLSASSPLTESAELHLVLHDLSGHPINVSEGMEFVQSGTNVPYVQVSAIDYSKNFSGEYKATVTGGGEGIATLIPVLNGVHQAGLNTTIEFISAEARPMTGTVSVNGATLPAASFPSQGFTGAYYQLNNDNFAPGKTAADYAFSSTASWVDVDTSGKVTFKNVGDRNAVIITATPRSGGAIYQTQVRVKGWWVNHGNNLMQLSQAENYCSNQVGNGYTLPRADLLSNGHMRREIGSLYGEWGDMGNYMNEADFYSMVYWSSNSAGAGQQYIVSLETGTQNTYQTHEFFYGACYKQI
ncbi:TPA: Ig-like domain-containing protein, partial [Escherichia coli]|nr:Ig-like domain-containing protein [Escherichia coli]